MARVLIVDPDNDFLVATAKFCTASGHNTFTASSLAEARRLLRQHSPDVLLIDLIMPDGNGLEILEAAWTDRAELQRIGVLTGHPGVKDLIRDIRGPSVTYLTKPVDSAELLGIVGHADDTTPADEDEHDVESWPAAQFGLLVGDSPQMQQVYSEIEQVAPLDTTVFIQGESGTGKELVARAIHRLSGRSGRIVPVNCGGLSQELLTSQLFGHEKGSFTGANRRHKGYFEQASGGTLFLDEITEMPVDAQASLLRALESNRIIRVGSESETPVDVRLLAATNREPAEAVSEGLLREDLYFRLQVFPIRLPPLRARKGDTRLLAEFFLQQLNRDMNANQRFSDAAYSRLASYAWPGNVRELENAVHRSVVLAGTQDGEIGMPDDIGDDARETTLKGLSPGRSIRDVERDLIMLTLEHYGRDKKAAAASLGVSLKTLYNRLNTYDAAKTAEM